MDRVLQFLGNPITQSILGFIYGVLLPIWLYRRGRKRSSAQSTSLQEGSNQISCLRFVLLMLLTLILIFLLNRVAKISYYTFFSAVIGSILAIGLYLLIVNIRKNRQKMLVKSNQTGKKRVEHNFLDCTLSTSQLTAELTAKPLDTDEFHQMHLDKNAPQYPHKAP